MNNQWISWKSWGLVTRRSVKCDSIDSLRASKTGKATSRARTAHSLWKKRRSAAKKQKLDHRSALVFVNYLPWALTFIAIEQRRHVQLHLGLLSLSLRTPTCGSLPHLTAVTCGLSLSGGRWWWLTASRRSLSRLLYLNSQQPRRETAGSLVALRVFDAHKMFACCCFQLFIEFPSI